MSTPEVVQVTRWAVRVDGVEMLAESREHAEELAAELTAARAAPPPAWEPDDVGLTPAQAARALRTSTRWLPTLAYRHRIAVALTTGGHRRYRATDVRRAARERHGTDGKPR